MGKPKKSGNFGMEGKIRKPPWKLQMINDFYDFFYILLSLERSQNYDIFFNPAVLFWGSSGRVRNCPPRLILPSKNYFFNNQILPIRTKVRISKFYVKVDISMHFFTYIMVLVKNVSFVLK